MKQVKKLIDGFKALPRKRQLLLIGYIYKLSGKKLISPPKKDKKE